MPFVTGNQDDSTVVAFGGDGSARDFTLLVDAHTLDDRETSVVRNELIEIKQRAVFPEEAMRVVLCNANIVVGKPHHLPSGIDGHAFSADVAGHDAEI